MGKASKKRRLEDNYAMAVDRSVRSSAQKLNLVASSIRGMNASKALLELQFSNKRIAGDVKKVLQSDQVSHFVCGVKNIFSTENTEFV